MSERKTRSVLNLGGRRSFLIYLEAQTPLDAERLGKEIEKLFSEARASVHEIGGQQ